MAVEQNGLGFLDSPASTPVRSGEGRTLVCVGLPCPWRREVHACCFPDPHEQELSSPLSGDKPSLDSQGQGWGINQSFLLIHSGVQAEDEPKYTEAGTHSDELSSGHSCESPEAMGTPYVNSLALWTYLSLPQNHRDTSGPHVAQSTSHTMQIPVALEQTRPEPAAVQTGDTPKPGICPSQRWPFTVKTWVEVAVMAVTIWAAFTISPSPHHTHFFCLAEVLNTFFFLLFSIFRFALWTLLDINFKHWKSERKIKVWRFRWCKKKTGSNKHCFLMGWLVPVGLL